MSDDIKFTFNSIELKHSMASDSFITIGRDTLQKRVDINKVTEGHLDGQKVWICDYRQSSVDKKPVRALKPIEVIIKSNTELPKGKSIYYSQSHFRPLKRDGTPASRIIPVFDNTGFRTFTGTPVAVFDNREDCVAHFRSQIERIIDMYQSFIGDIYKKVDFLHAMTEDV